ncbi:MAG TPA: serine/threonine-protein kinase [Verrucomicrobiae bacterium]|nr:serine/threonine-protein kinase [Verrucomicrobiae bacterium]
MFSADENSGGGGAPRQFGRFYLQELINSGGMADIWLATDSRNKPYALRLMHDRYRFNLFAKKRFLKGCDVLATIPDSEFIISYVEHGKVKGQPYLVMEYVEAENLKILFARSDALLLENVAQILIDMATGLEHMHENGYMHLDFKPENVLITRNAGVRLVDFDLAQPISDKPIKLSKNPGTPAYMPPEQLQGQPLTHRVDVFAFGVAAYELLTNCLPFPGDTPSDILRLELDRSGFILPRQHNPDLPLNVEKIIMKCLENEPEKRYPFMSLMARELRSALYV